jgi:membrane-associated phospholipid phosphatase
MDFVGDKAAGSTYNAVYQSIGESNPVAAMPSIHMAVTFAMYLWARDHQRRIAPYLLAYSIIMGLALIYLAEHYTLDLLAGVTCALACHLVTRRVVPIPATEAPAPATTAPAYP